MITHNGIEVRAIIPPQRLRAKRITRKPVLRQRVTQSQLQVVTPGYIFAWVIFKVTGQKTANCGVCGQRKRQMNQWGWWGCWKNRNTIVEWLCQEANKRGHSISKPSMLSLLKAAFKESVKPKGKS